MQDACQLLKKPKNGALSIDESKYLNLHIYSNLYQ
jgi:hypothetical protein